MRRDQNSLFDTQVWRPALEKYGAVTRLTVALYDTNHRLVCDPLPSTPLFEFFRDHGCEPGILMDCARRCAGSTTARPGVTVCQSYGLAVVGTSLMLDGKIVGAAVAGYSLVDFCQASAIEWLAHHVGVPFRQLWTMSLQIQPVPERRLALYGELLGVLGETILRENDRTRQVQDIAAHLERRVDERTQELAFANHSLALELNQRIEAETRVRELLARLVIAQEEERHRIARDAHDHLGQLMIALKLRLELLGTDGADWKEHLVAAETLLKRLDADLESFTKGLRPRMLEDLGLAAALAAFVADWSRTHGIAARFHTAGIGNVRLSADAEINLFRIVQEALNNIHKHANATNAGVRLQVDDEAVVLTIEDDGDGFVPSPRTEGDIVARMGLIGMQERAALMHGTLDVQTTTHGGTVVTVAVPTGFNVPAR